MSPHHVIACNFPWCPEQNDASFLGRLHEEGVWDTDEYWRLEWALYQLVNEAPRSQETSWRVFRIFSHTFLSLGCHFDPNDGFKLKDLTNDEIYELRERVQLVFEGYFSGSMPEQAIFSIQNPMLKTLFK